MNARGGMKGNNAKDTLRYQKRPPASLKDTIRPAFQVFFPSPSMTHREEEVLPTVFCLR